MKLRVELTKKIVQAIPSEEKQKALIREFDQKNHLSLYWYKSFDAFSKSFLSPNAPSGEITQYIPSFGRLDMMNDREELSIYLFHKPSMKKLLKRNNKKDSLYQFFEKKKDTKLNRAMYLLWKYFLSLLVFEIILCFLIHLFPACSIFLGITNQAIIIVWFIYVLFKVYLYRFACQVSVISMTELEPSGDGSDEHWGDYAKSGGISIEYSITDLIDAGYIVEPVVYEDKTLVKLFRIFGFKLVYGYMLTKEKRTILYNKDNSVDKIKNSIEEKEWRILKLTSKEQYLKPSENDSECLDDRNKFTMGKYPFPKPKKIYYKGLSNSQIIELRSITQKDAIDLVEC